MKKQSKFKLLTLLSLLSLFCGLTSIVTTNFKSQVIAEDSLTESSFKKVNIYNNNVYEESGQCFRTMLEFTEKFSSSDKSGMNIATSSQDLGQKMTLNGVAVKNIPNFFASYYDAGSSGPMILFRVPEPYIEPTPGFSHTTLFMPAGTIIYDGITKNDTLIFISNEKWMTSEKWSPIPETIDPFDYSFAIVGDTQDINYNAPDDYHKIYDWIVDNKDSKKIAHTIGLGDITEKNSESEWNRARNSFDKLENAGMTHTQVRGNHDMRPEFNDFFENDAYYRKGIVETYENMSNFYRKFRVGTNDYLILALDYEPSDNALIWANQVVENHPYHNVIVVTHGYLYRDGTTLSPGDDLCPAGNNGEDIWDKLVRKHKNITMVLSGHIHCENVLVSTQVGDYGNNITQVLIDPQQIDRSGTKSGLIAMFYFSNDGKNVQIEYYSTILELYETTSAQKKIVINRIEPLCLEHSYVLHNATDASCEKAGNIKYWTCATEGCECVFVENAGGNKIEVSMDDVIIPKLDHVIDPDSVSFTFAADYQNATISYNSINCHASFQDDADVSSEILSSATCFEEGQTKYTTTYLTYSYSETVSAQSVAHNPESVVEIPGLDATCAVGGYKKSYKCNDCGKYFEDQALTILIGNQEDYNLWISNPLGGFILPNDNHGEFIHWPGVLPTCKNAGTKDYFECSVCHKYFSSEDSGSLIGNADDLELWLNDLDGGLLPIDPNNHAGEFVHHDAIASTCYQEGNKEYYTCSDCGAYFVKITGGSYIQVSLSSLILEKDTEEHNFEFIEEMPATTEKEGVKAHYVCRDCGKVFIKDNELFIEVSMNDLIIAKITIDSGIDSEPSGLLGCVGSIGGVSIVISMISVLCCSLIVLKKKCNHDIVEQ